MKSIFETCRPREDVLRGELRDEMFAASLQDVIQGKADAVYGEPAVFFARSFPAQGMVRLLNEALGRLSGARPSNSPIIRLETSFGGGKTHNLIALYHAARMPAGHASILDGFVDPDVLPETPLRHIVGVVGSDLDPVNGVDHGDAKTHTLWGEIAYRLGGKDGYELVRESDAQGVAAGPQPFERLIGDKPALIMIDEFAALLRKASGVKVGNTTLAEQTTAFLLTLLSFVAVAPRTVTVITLAESADAFASETDRTVSVLRDVSKILARQETIITPAGERDIVPIVVRRLFERVAPDAGADVGRAYRAHYEAQVQRQAELPEHVTRFEYEKEIAAHYPFAPEFISALNRKTSTIPEFQRTRGALRLLAGVVRRLWETRPPDAHLIHAHHLDLGYEGTLNELTSRLGRPKFRSVVQADIMGDLEGAPAHAAQVDGAFVDSGRPPYARRFAVTVFLHSLVSGSASGIEPAEALLSICAPGDDAAIIQKAVDGLLERAWFLEYDGRKHRFKTEPSLNKLIADEMQGVPVGKAKEELDRRVKNLWRKGVFTPVFFPAEAADVDDDALAPKLALMHYDAASAGVDDAEPPPLVRRIFERAGTAHGFRLFKNNTLFLVVDKDQKDRITELSKRCIAVHRIASDVDRIRDFADEQRKKIKKMSEEADIGVRVGISKAYRHLYYPSAGAPDEAGGGLAREILSPQEQATSTQDECLNTLKALRQLEKVVAADDPPPAAEYVKARAWPVGKNYASTADTARAFAQRLGLRMLLDPGLLKTAIRHGCKNGVWVYQHPGGAEVYGKPSPVAPVEITDDAFLYTPEEAERLGLKVIGEKEIPELKFCPVCKNPVNQCTCGAKCAKCGKLPCVCGKPIPVLTAEGAPGEAFQKIADTAKEHKVSRIKNITVTVEGNTKETASDVRLLGLAAPQLPTVDIAVDQTVDCRFASEDVLQLQFTGSWERYREVKKLTDGFGQSADEVSVRMRMTASFPGGLDPTGKEFAEMANTFQSLGVGRVTLEAAPGEPREPDIGD